MYCRLVRWLLTLLMLAGGALVPPAAWASDYLLFAGEASGTTCSVYQINNTNTIMYYNSYAIGWNAGNAAISPDGKMVVMGSSVNPMLSVFFINEDRSLSGPTYLDNPILNSSDYLAWNPITFHRSLPLLYCGFHPIYLGRYALTEHEINMTTQTLSLDWMSGYNIGYSSWSNTLVCLINDLKEVRSWCQTVNLHTDGSFGTLNSPVGLPNFINYDFAVSPDGHWVAGSSFAKLHLLRVDQDGSLTLTQTVAFRAVYGYDILSNFIAFTPDSQRILVLGFGGTLLLYQIDPEHGTVSLLDSLEGNVPGWSINSAVGLTISPDGQFAAFRSINRQNPSHSWIHMVKIHKDGTLEYLKGKEQDVDHILSAMCLALLPARNNCGTEWLCYE